MPPIEPQVRTSWPPFIEAGTTLKIDRQISDYPNTDWLYTLYLAGPSVANVAAAADPNSGDLYHIVLSATASAALITGAYTFVGRLSAIDGDGEVYDYEKGVLQVNPNIALATAGDYVSHAVKTLAVIEAALEGRLTSDIESYSIAGRSVSKIPVRELIGLRGTYSAIVWKQNNPGKLMSQVEVSFPPTDAGLLPRRGFERLP